MLSCGSDPIAARHENLLQPAARPGILLAARPPVQRRAVMSDLSTGDHVSSEASQALWQAECRAKHEMGFGSGEGLEPATFSLEGLDLYAVWHASWKVEYFVSSYRVVRALLGGPTSRQPRPRVGGRQCSLGRTVEIATRRRQ